MERNRSVFTGKRYDTLEPTRVFVEDGKIVATERAEEIDGLPWLAPGLFDIQVNGAVGVEFSSSRLTVDGVCSAFDKILRDGVFRCCPTLTTNAPETMIESAKTIADAIKQRAEFQRFVWGIHLEGPFISTAEGAIGAHPKQYCREYSIELFERVQESCGGLVKIVTLSPEYPRAPEFIERLRAQGIVVAIGHTNATPVQIDAAVRAGAQLSTHLSNATRHLLPKWENYCFTQLADDRLFASMIMDGFHVSPQLARIIARAKGLDRLVLISDQSPLAGFPPGKYSMELCEFEIQPNGKVTLSGDPNLLACASFPVSNGVANLATIESLKLRDAYSLATTNPAKLLDAPKFSNSAVDFLEKGAAADFLVFRLVPATFGEHGIADGASFKTGRFEFESILWNGRNLI